MANEAVETAKKLVVVEITADDKIEPSRSYTDKATGMQKPLPARQTVWLWCGKRHPIEMKIDVPAGASPYRPGMYLLGGGIFTASKFGRVEFNDRELLLIAAEDAIASLGGELPSAKSKAA